MKVFTEEQKFNQWWMYAALILVFTGALTPFVLEKDKLRSGDHESVMTLVLIIITLGLTFIFIRSVKLTTKIDEIGIHYKFFPIHLNMKIIKWEEINFCEVKKHLRIKNFGGYGRHINGKSVKIRGYKGIQVILKSNKRMLIGTQQAELAEKTIETYRNRITTT
ncbi:hypothetical protein MQE36_00805 [Zhouia spongiae]|uniref:PH domain-containing protein n=1 Tax=Zhouia spongiae TaxID=2202721 RepID=A0ABY3YM54_9FLAO|nr:hypothetical protein [Zhouia spongiae]UNY98910.1 hypothetical protein MQE36_00805 [Zhouia spongiae]